MSDINPVFPKSLRRIYRNKMYDLMLLGVHNFTDEELETPIRSWWKYIDKKNSSSMTRKS